MYFDGHTAMASAVGAAVSVVFVVASIGYGIKERLCRDESPDRATTFSAPVSVNTRRGRCFWGRPE